uniref:Uncharacterized protein n=1 Tax=Oryza glumipatula TaxID=40148 RepID=A0A0E0B433_9ORYZ
MAKRLGEEGLMQEFASGVRLLMDPAWTTPWRRPGGEAGHAVDAAAEEEEDAGHRTAAGSGGDEVDDDADEEERIPSGRAGTGHADADDHREKGENRGNKERRLTWITLTCRAHGNSAAT